LSYTPHAYVDFFKKKLIGSVWFCFGGINDMLEGN
jgi:hypothetical protein